MAAGSNRPWALVPVKAFAAANSRLSPLLDARERALLAEAMLGDVLAALRQASTLAGIVLLGGTDAKGVADAHGCEWLNDTGRGDLNAALGAAAEQLAARGAATLMVLPDDLPLLRAADVSALLAGHAGGLSLNPAARDGGTNALVISPPNAIRFCFGADSASRHCEQARAAGLPARQLSLPAFARDIDRPEDLAWLCAQGPRGQTGAFLAAAGVVDRLRPEPAAVYQS